MKRTLCMLLCLILLVACAPTRSETTGIPADTATPPPPPISLITPNPAYVTGPEFFDGIREIKWLIPVILTQRDYNAAVERVKGILAQINPRLKETGSILAIELRQVRLIDEDELLSRRYVMKDDIIRMLTSSEWIDLISVPANFVPVTELIDLGLIKEISLDIERYPNLREALDPKSLSLTYYKNGLYGVPAGYDTEMDLKRNYLGVNRETWETLGLTGIGTTAELLETSAQARLRLLPHEVYHGNDPLAYRRDYPQFPFKISEDKFFIYHHDGSVEPYVDSDIFWQDFALAQSIWASFSQERKEAAEFDPYAMQVWGDLSAPSDFADLLYRLEDYDDFVPVKLAPEKPLIRTASTFGKIYNVVPEKCPDPYALGMLDWIYQNPDIYNLFQDTSRLMGGNTELELHWRRPESIVAYEFGLANTHIYDPDDVATALSNYYYSLFECVKQSTMTDYGQLQSETLGTVYADTSFEAMPWDGFVFDPTSINDTNGGGSVAEQLAWVRSAFDFTYFVEPTTAGDFSNVSSQMNEAGFGLLLEECRRQYAEFQKNKGVGW